MNTEKYLNRINYKGELNTNLKVLKQLQETHLLNVPFENLDIHYGNTIDLDLDKIYHKIVIKKRGGFCYELNGLFHMLLKKIGFDAKIISARVYDSKNNSFGKEYDHLAIIVRLEEMKYLVDVGFGEFTFHPLKLEINKIQSDPRGNFLVEKQDDKYYKISKVEDKTKSIEYIFTEQESAFNEFADMCNYHQTNANSHFTQKKLISKATKSGRITITQNTLKITESGEIKTNLPFEVEDYKTHLFKWFNIEEAEIKARH